MFRTEGGIALALQEVQAQAGGRHVRPVPLPASTTPQLGQLEETKLNGVVMFLVKLNRSKNELSHFFPVWTKQIQIVQSKPPESRCFMSLPAAVSLTLTGASWCGHARSTVKSDTRSSLEDGF